MTRLDNGDDYLESIRSGREVEKEDFYRFLRDVETGRQDMCDPNRRRLFADENPLILSAWIEDLGNMLHFLASRDTTDLPSWEKLEPLVEILVQFKLLEQNIDLLMEQDSNGKTPLHIAAAAAKKKEKEQLLYAMCKAHSNIDRVLEIQCQKNETVIHVAINKMVGQDCVRHLVGLAQKETGTLCKQDSSGNTPLHVAVDYRSCVEGQLAVVQALIDQDDKALDVSNSAGLSPYRYHEETTINYNRENKSQESELQRGGLDSSRRGSVVRSLGPATGGPTHPNESQQLNPWEGGSHSQGSFLKTNTMDVAPGKYGAGSARGAVAATPTSNGLPKLNFDFNRRVDGSNSRIPEQAPAAKAPARPTNRRLKSGSKEGPKPSPSSAKDIKRLLKVHYLRTRKHDAAVQFLYGSTLKYQIYFDLYGCGPVISYDFLKPDYFEFEDVLQYVAVPQLQIEVPVPVQRKGPARPAKPDCHGRKDLVFLFKWLKDEKNVKTVLRVIVDDLQEPGHSDQAIEEAIDGLGVEIWDWRRTDLCSEVIFKAAPQVQVLYLYWSGNNSALREWSEREGLSKLTRLEKVHLNIHQGLETSQRIDKNVREFKERMKKHCPSVEVQCQSPRSSFTEGTVAQADALRAEREVRHQWLITMDAFASFLANAENSLRQNNQNPELDDPITVALIDDGISMDDISLQSRIVGGRSFCQRDENQNLNESFYISSSGHGTAMASLISRVCPTVKLYILKLSDYATESGSRQIDAESATKAIKAAVDRGVHIISMSWTIDRTGSNEKALEELESAIHSAAQRNILMFCSATDQGIFKDHSYPGESSTKKIFKIGAAEASGTAFKWVGDQTKVDFIFPGHKVVKERPGSVSAEKYTPLTGSSVATALASGLAAVILYCVQLGARFATKDHHVTMDDYHALKSHEQMKKAFLEIGTADTQMKYIAVWKRFAGPVEEFEKNRTLERTDVIADLAAMLKPRG